MIERILEIITHPIFVTVFVVLFLCSVIWIVLQPKPGLYDVYVYSEKKHDDVKVRADKNMLFVWGNDGKFYEYSGNWEIVSQ